jgi:glycosyltransferase involved in cell wall biosynthesis
MVGATPDARPRLLMFNLVTNTDDPILGFGVGWIRSLARHCSAVDVVTMSAGPADLPANVRVFSVGKEKGWSEPRRAVMFYRVLFRLLRAHRYDGCFAHMMPLFAYMGAPLLKARRIPVTLWFTHISTRVRLRLAVRSVDHVITADRASFSLDSDKLAVTGHGIDTDYFSPSPTTRGDGPVRLLSVGRIDPIKHHDILIAAVAELMQGDSPPPLAVRIIGYAYPECRGYEADLHAQVAREGLSEIVRFEPPGPQHHVLDAYRNSDVMVSLSKDNFDKVALEAMSCGLPVVTTNPAFGSLLRSAGAAGPVALDASAVAVGLGAVLALDEQQRAEIGAALRIGVIAEHSLDRLVQRLIDGMLFTRRTDAPNI